MTSALIVVDVQNDFCEGGALAVAGGAAVAAKISRMLNAGTSYDVVVATRDQHIDPGAHFSEQPDYVDSWPPHCVVGTPGAELHPNLTFEFEAVFDKGARAAAYSGFEGNCNEQYLVDYLRERGVTHVDVCGIATDYCVRATALDAKRSGFDTRVLLDLTAAVHPDRVHEVEAELSSAGVEVEHVRDLHVSWEVVERRLLAEGRVSSYVSETVLTPAGERMERQFLSHPGAVGIVAWDEGTDEIVVVRQYRHPVGMELVEIPAGLLDAEGETWQASAARELAEEAGLGAERWQVLVDVCTTPGASAETLRIFLARGLSAAGAPAGFVAEGEEAEMRVQRVKRAELVAAILDGRCQSPSLVAGVLALDSALNAGRVNQLRDAEAPWPVRD